MAVFLSSRKRAEQKKQSLCSGGNKSRGQNFWFSERVGSGSIQIPTFFFSNIVSSSEESPPFPCPFPLIYLTLVTMSQRPRRSKANLHPGHILCDFEIHRRTSEQKKADDEACQQAKDDQVAELQKAYDHIGALENAMAEKQARESIEVPIKPLKPRPRPVKKSPGTVSGQAQGQYQFYIRDFNIRSRKYQRL